MKGATTLRMVSDHAATAEPSSSDPRCPLVATRFRGVMEAFGLDLSDSNLADTPMRVARAWREMLAGLDESTAPALRTFPNPEGYSRMVAVNGIPFYSICAHHFLPFFGTAHVGYAPGDRVVGLSKLPRVIEHYARRPQTQERLTEQAIDFLDRGLAPRGVMVVLQARHLCVEMRGVLKPGTVTTTSAFRGVFEDERMRHEFLGLVEKNSLHQPGPMVISGSG